MPGRRETVTNKVVGENIKQRRKYMKMTQKELSRLIGCDVQTISLYERGKFLPASDVLYKLSQVLEISIDEILGNTTVYQINDIELLRLFQKIDKFSIKDKESVKEILKMVRPSK